MSDETRVVVIDYTNHRGKRAKRRILPHSAFWARGTEYHKDQPGWYIRAECLEKGEFRDFAMKDIHSWEPSDV